MFLIRSFHLSMIELSCIESTICTILSSIRTTTKYQCRLSSFIGT
ncbi:hypothetical protein LINPERPRIM_LOCUS347 [Linum perenne]